MYRYCMKRTASPRLAKRCDPQFFLMRTFQYKPIIPLWLVEKSNGFDACPISTILQYCGHSMLTGEEHEGFVQGKLDYLCSSTSGDHDGKAL